MKILVCPADRGGCGHYRLIWPAEALAAEGHDVVVLDEKDTLARGYYGAGDELVAIDPPECDVVVLQRVLRRDIFELIPFLQAAGIAVVVEVDDDFTNIDPRNVAYNESQPSNPEKNYEWLLRACALADLVTVSTPALAGVFAPHGRVAVLENCVPERYLQEPAHRLFKGETWKPGKKLRLGWSGATNTHPGDLDVTSGAVQRVMDRHRGYVTTYIIGAGVGVQDALGLREEPQASGWRALKDYPRTLAQLDLGIVPLRRCTFNRSKSWLKGLEMAAVGVPFVASSTPEYERLAKLGAGRLAARPHDWERELSRLIRDDGFRKDQIAQGREVAKLHTIERNAPRWLSAWTEARALRMAA